ncbi:4Fe-4S binding protein [Siculibacillus lacustris]|uniref:4Fe-4S binding protein n=1 Tax=Siculibacillus lacustris TaxID=1549641 RepID=A0A4Q9VSX0_9HYPH|nr:4Fe-4S binding protein [Siculibacillus lacustris]TBW38033.1 4Fe-4S binding protein [Siculibacillus lacustris]
MSLGDILEAAPDDRAAEPTDRIGARIDVVLAKVGDLLLRHRTAIHAVQWTMVAIYVTLIVVPVIVPLPGRLDHVWSHATLFAQFVFWGIWWPFVLVSMVLVGRVWCGLMCPEGALTELASRHGRAGAIPRIVTWAGWPFVAFASTTIYGQMISVYQYPAPVLVILGGSTVAAVGVGYLWGRDKRVWCRFLCPVNGVFRVLSKLAPVHFRVDGARWDAFRLTGAKPERINCAPMVALPTMRGNSHCHMCGRCSGFRGGSITLSRRSPNHEIVHVAGDRPDPWETALIVFGLMGIAVGAFHWSSSPWFIDAKQMVADGLADAGILWPLTVTPPWWILTHYPAQNDVLSLLDGALLVTYILATATVIGGVIAIGLVIASLIGGGWSSRRFHHYAQTLIPMAGTGVFLGLSALTVTLLKSDGIVMDWVEPLRIGLLAGASTWSAWLIWRVAGLYRRSVVARAATLVAMLPAIAISDTAWWLFFWGW